MTKRLLVGVLTIGGLLAALVGTATAWSASPTGEFACVVSDDGIELGLDWTVTSWEPGETMGENPSIVVEMSRDGGPAEVLATGAFTPENGGEFTGSVIVPEGPGSLTLTARADAPWGDGTVDNAATSVDLTVPTLAELDDPNCVATPTPEPTVEPTPTAEPEPTATPEEVTPPETETTPTPEVEGETVVQTPTEEPEEAPDTEETPAEEAPAAEAEALAQTGNETVPLAAVGLTLIGVGALAFWARRPNLGRG